MDTLTPLGGLFDSPQGKLKLQANASNGQVNDSPCTVDPDSYECLFPCGLDAYLNQDGICVFIATGVPVYDPNGGGPVVTYPTGQPTISSNPQSTSDTTTSGSPTGSVVVNNTINISNDGIDRINAAITEAIKNTQAQTDALIQKVRDSVQSAIGEESDGIKASIGSANDNLAQSITVTTAAAAATNAATATAITKSITDQVDAVKKEITPILSSITKFIDQINAEVQKINDTFIQPIVTLYTTTIGEISTLTKAIETDLKEGISGLLKVPGQLADQLGSLDATLNRTIQQLGLANKEIAESNIKFAGETLPTPFGAAMSSAFAGTLKPDGLHTTFTDHVPLNSESLSKVSSQAISSLGHLLKELLHITTSTSIDSYNQLSTDWKSVGGAFTGLLDGALTLLTTITAVGAIAEPLISAAQQEAKSLVPTEKLDVATVIDALNRRFITDAEGIKELKNQGLDESRIKILYDLSTYFAAAEQSLEWFYRGVSTEADLEENLKQHSYDDRQIAAYKAASIHLPSLGELLRWFNFGIINQEQFTKQCRMLRHDESQIEAILTTYQDRENAQTLAQLNGLLDNSGAGFIEGSLRKPVPESMLRAGQRQGLHPDLIHYIWVGHWHLPSVNEFIEMYFRGFRTRTEVNQRMAIDNIPEELWDEIVEIKRPLLPLRMIPSAFSKGLIDLPTAERELRSHGHNEQHIQLVLSAYAPKEVSTTSKDVAEVIELSVANAKTLWTEGALSDEQYLQILVHHDYPADLAKLKVDADKVQLHIKQQKDMLSDLEAQVLAGIMTGDEAISQLVLNHFTDAQISKFALKVQKALRAQIKTPSIPELNKFLKAQLISVDDYAAGLQALGWAEPWLSAFMSLVVGGEEIEDEQPTTA